MPVLRTTMTRVNDGVVTEAASWRTGQAWRIVPVSPLLPVTKRAVAARFPGPSSASFFSTHPPGPERVATLRALAARLPNS